MSVSTMFESMGFVAFTELCDGLPGVLACAKDLDRRYVYANDRFAERCGQRTVADVIGRTAADFFPPDLVEMLDRQDDHVLRTGRALQDHLETILHTDGTPRWWVTSKARHLADDGRPLGLLVLSVEVATLAEAGHDAHAGLAIAVDHIRAHLISGLRVEDLAAAADVSVPQLERLTRRVFGLAPTKLVQRLRLEEAMHRLSHTRQPIKQIAAECGFYDQPTLTRTFRSATGLTPAAYRTRHPFTPT